VNEPSQASEPGKARSRLGVVIALSIVVALGALLAWMLEPPAGRSAAPPWVQAPPDAGAAPP
jgi:hypothetical protein